MTDAETFGGYYPAFFTFTIDEEIEQYKADNPEYHLSRIHRNADYSLIRVIRQQDGCSLETVADELPYQEEYVESRIEVLQRIGVVEQVSDDQHTVTEQGVEYLEGERSLDYEEV